MPSPPSPSSPSSSSSISPSNPAGRLVLDGQAFSDRVVDSVAIRLLRNIDCGHELVQRWRDEITELREENQYALGYLSTLERCSCAPPPKKGTRKYTVRNPSHQKTRMKDRDIDPFLDIGDDCLGLSSGNAVIIPPTSNPVFQKYTVVGTNVSEARDATPVELHSKVGMGMIKKQQSPSSSSSSSPSYALASTAEQQDKGMGSRSGGTSSNHPRSTSIGSIDDEDVDVKGDDDSSPLEGGDGKLPPKSKMVVYGYTSSKERSRICDWGKRGGMARCHPYYGFIHLCGSSIEWFFPKGDVTLTGFFREGKKEVAII